MLVFADKIDRGEPWVPSDAEPEGSLAGAPRASSPSLLMNSRRRSRSRSLTWIYGRSSVTTASYPRSKLSIEKSSATTIFASPLPLSAPCPFVSHQMDDRPPLEQPVVHLLDPRIELLVRTPAQRAEASGHVTGMARV
jgi:hypothetical protein